MKRKIRVPKPFRRIFKIRRKFGRKTEDWEFKKCERIEGYDCHFLAYLKPFRGDLEWMPILTDDPDFPIVELVNGRLYPVDIEDV